MADQEIDFASARNAWGYFYSRHHNFLSRVCARNYGHLIGTEGVEDLVQDAFLRAFDRAVTFDHLEVCDTAAQEPKCRRWLARIAANLVNDLYKTQPSVSMTDDSAEEADGPANEETTESQVPESERLKLLQSGLALLSDVEQTILRATMLWWKPDQQHQRMPHAAMEQLSKQVDKSPDTIRQIRSRAVRKLEKYVNDQLSQ